MKKHFNCTHGMNKTRFCHIWRGIKTRCFNKNNRSFRKYGGRGVGCLWKSFEEFRDDMYESYQSHVKEFGEKETTIDRLDNAGHYCKKNCRWSTYEEQNNNRRNSILVSFCGKTLTIKDWAKETGITYKTLNKRIVTMGWSIERSLTEPVNEIYQLI